MNDATDPKRHTTIYITVSRLGTSESENLEREVPLVNSREDQHQQMVAVVQEIYPKASLVSSIDEVWTFADDDREIASSYVDSTTPRQPGTLDKQGGLFIENDTLLPPDDR